MSAPPASPFAAFLATLPGAGVFSAWLGPVDGPPDFAHRAEERHYAASTMKLHVLAAAHRAAEKGRLDLDAPVRVHDDFSSAADGSTFRMRQDYDNDDVVWDRVGSTAPVRWLAERMIVRSSNLAANLVLEQVGLPAVREVLRDLGLRHTAIGRGIEDEAAREAGLDNLVTAADLASTLQGVASSPEIMATLQRQELRDTIPAGLPEDTVVAHKSGWVEGVSHDAGIILPAEAEPFVLVVCTTSTLSEAEGRELIARAARAAWQERGLTR